MSNIKNRDVFTGDDFLVEYERLTKRNASQQQQSAQSAPSSRDATKRVLDVLINGPATFAGLLDQSATDYLDLGSIVARLQKMDAIVVSGTGPGQTIELTDHGREMAKVLTAAS